MKKSDVLKLILTGATTFIPGGAAVKGGIDAILEAKRDTDDDDDDDVDEIAGAVARIAIGAVQGVEALSEKDLINDPVLAQLVANIRGDLLLARLLVVRRPAPPT